MPPPLSAPSPHVAEEARPDTGISSDPSIRLSLDGMEVDGPIDEESSSGQGGSWPSSTVSSNTESIADL